MSKMEGPSQDHDTGRYQEWQAAHLRVEMLVLGNTSQSFSTAADVNVPLPMRMALMPQSALLPKLPHEAMVA